MGNDGTENGRTYDNPRNPCASPTLVVNLPIHPQLAAARNPCASPTRGYRTKLVSYISIIFIRPYDVRVRGERATGAVAPTQGYKSFLLLYILILGICNNVKKLIWGGGVKELVAYLLIRHDP